MTRIGRARVLITLGLCRSGGCSSDPSIDTDTAVDADTAVEADTVLNSNASVDADTGMALKGLDLADTGYCSSNNPPPANADELIDFVETGDNPLHQDAIPALRNRELVVQWSVNAVAGATQPDLVLAYYKDIPQNGGYVGFLDGKVQRVSSADFSLLTRMCG